MFEPKVLIFSMCHIEVSTSIPVLTSKFENEVDVEILMWHSIKSDTSHISDLLSLM